MNVINVESVEQSLAKIAAYAVYPTAKLWVMRVPRNHLLGEELDEKDMANFVLYDPKKPVFGMPTVKQLPDWAKERLKAGEQLHWFDSINVRRRPFWQALDHIVTWFNAWPETDTRLQRLDRMCFGTAASAAGMWMKDVCTNIWHYAKDRPQTAHEFNDGSGFKWVKMVTALQFEREGQIMGHCVGNGGYYDQYAGGRAEYYSLRDKHNNPHCTCEVRVGSPSTLVQCKGKSNQKPGPKYQPYMRPFFELKKWKIQGDTHNID